MGQIEDLRVFLSVVDNGGIAKAADDLGIAKSAVSRRLAQLEERYSVLLIDRRPRMWEVTTAGQELYQRSKTMVADVDELDADFTHSSHSLNGPLSVSIAREFGLGFLKPALFDFMVAHPEIDLTIDFDDRTVDLDRENYDMAIRITPGDLSGLISCNLGESRHGLYASASYIAEHGRPETIEDLSDHALLYFGAARRANWEFLDASRRSVTFEFQPALNSNSGPFLLHAAQRGLGIARLPDFIRYHSQPSVELEEILPNQPIADWGIHLVYSENRRLNRRMRALMEALQECCATLN